MYTLRLYTGFAYWSSDDDEKAEENDNRKIVPSGRRLRSHRTMSALSPEKERGHGVANAWPRIDRSIITASIGPAPQFQPIR